ncbi:hypothetical protein KC19_8G052000 [Ceratodon purpureus]|uniref:Uncharacterized protein n=1 Tax=Ceratodon purpureus TaxID=3225 RepID=A0A8T0GXR8_CERPU|nr:hypothetical protein KC19_8G052000 [Ceratodon purpureus]
MAGNRYVNACLLEVLSQFVTLKLLFDLLGIKCIFKISFICILFMFLLYLPLRFLISPATSSFLRFLSTMLTYQGAGSSHQIFHVKRSHSLCWERIFGQPDSPVD